MLKSYEYTQQCIKDGALFFEEKKTIQCWSEAEFLKQLNEWNRLAGLSNKMGQTNLSWHYYQ